MKSLFHKPQFPTKIFIAASMAVFIMFVFSLLMFKAVIRGSRVQSFAVNHQPSVKNDIIDDPLITKVPNIKDLIKKPIITDSDPTEGNDKAKINIVIYSDFQCKYCKEQEQVIKDLIAKHPDNVRLIWKDYPENNVDSASYKSSMAAGCAHEQGKFWEYHDLLFKNSGNQDAGLFSRLAEELNLNLSNFDSCLSEKRQEKAVDGDIREADALGITGVPFIYVNDKEIMGQISLEELEEMVENELK